MKIMETVMFQRRNTQNGLNKLHILICASDMNTDG